MQEVFVDRQKKSIINSTKREEVGPTPPTVSKPTAQKRPPGDAHLHFPLPYSTTNALPGGEQGCGVPFPMNTGQQEAQHRSSFPLSTENTPFAYRKLSFEATPTPMAASGIKNEEQESFLSMANSSMKQDDTMTTNDSLSLSKNLSHQSLSYLELCHSRIRHRHDEQKKMKAEKLKLQKEIHVLQQEEHQMCFSPSLLSSSQEEKKKKKKNENRNLCVLECFELMLEDIAKTETEIFVLSSSSDKDVEGGEEQEFLWRHNCAALLKEAQSQCQEVILRLKGCERRSSDSAMMEHSIPLLPPQNGKEIVAAHANHPNSGRVLNITDDTFQHLQHIQHILLPKILHAKKEMVLKQKKYQIQKRENKMKFLQNEIESFVKKIKAVKEEVIPKKLEDIKGKLKKSNVIQEEGGESNILSNEKDMDKFCQETLQMSMQASECMQEEEVKQDEIRKVGVEQEDKEEEMASRSGGNEKISQHWLAQHANLGQAFSHIMDSWWIYYQAWSCSNFNFHHHLYTASMKRSKRRVCSENSGNIQNQNGEEQRSGGGLEDDKKNCMSFQDVLNISKASLCRRREEKSECNPHPILTCQECCQKRIELEGQCRHLTIKCAAKVEQALHKLEAETEVEGRKKIQQYQELLERKRKLIPYFYENILPFLQGEKVSELQQEISKVEGEKIESVIRKGKGETIAVEMEKEWERKQKELEELKMALFMGGENDDEIMKESEDGKNNINHRIILDDHIAQKNTPVPQKILAQKKKRAEEEKETLIEEEEQKILDSELELLQGEIQSISEEIAQHPKRGENLVAIISVGEKENIKTTAEKKEKKKNKQPEDGDDVLNQHNHHRHHSTEKMMNSSRRKNENSENQEHQDPILLEINVDEYYQIIDSLEAQVLHLAEAVSSTLQTQSENFHPKEIELLNKYRNENAELELLQSQSVQLQNKCETMDKELEQIYQPREEERSSQRCVYLSTQKQLQNEIETLKENFYGVEEEVQELERRAILHGVELDDDDDDDDDGQGSTTIVDYYSSLEGKNTYLPPSQKTFFGAVVDSSFAVPLYATASNKEDDDLITPVITTSPIRNTMKRQSELPMHGGYARGGETRGEYKGKLTALKMDDDDGAQQLPPRGGGGRLGWVGTVTRGTFSALWSTATFAPRYLFGARKPTTQK